MSGKPNAILLPGGAGYIGSHIVVELLERTPHTVIVVDNLSNAVGDQIDKNANPPSLARALKIAGQSLPAENNVESRLKFFYKEYDDIELLEQVNQKFNILATIIVAGHKAVGESKFKPLMYYSNNVCKTVNLLTALSRLNLKTVIFSSSATVYKPQHEDNIKPLSENMETGNCTNAYARTKFFIEEILKDLCYADKEWKACTLRYFNPVGAHPSGLIGEDPQGIPNNLMPYIAQVAVGRREKLTVFGNDYKTKDGTGVRDYLHVVDLAKAHVDAIDFLQKFEIPEDNPENKDGFNVINLGSGTGNSVLEVIGAFEEASEKKLPWVFGPRRDGDVTALYCKPEYAEEALGWKTEKTLLNMCADTWRFQKGNPLGYSKPKSGDDDDDGPKLESSKDSEIQAKETKNEKIQEAVMETES